MPFTKLPPAPLQANHGHCNPGMEAIVRGVERFESEIFPKNQAYYQGLVEQPQRPQALFITCADSRIHPNTITGTRPGSLFLIRNAGNIIPPYGTAGASGEAATIEYALSVLQVKNIILCGHSHCGAMRALLEGKLGDEIPSVKHWFNHSESVRRIFHDAHENGVTEEEVLEAVEENVIQQLEHLRTHPAVAVGLSRGDLNVYGWVYHLEQGKILSLDPISGVFHSISEKGITPLPTMRSRRSNQV